MWKTSRRPAPADILLACGLCTSAQGRKGRSLVAIAWDKQTCSQCPLRQQCLPPGQLQRVLRLSPYYTLLTTRRAEQKTTAFRERYRRRAGIEATFSHLVNVHRARRTPYCGPAKTLCYYAALAVGVNLRRVALWEAWTTSSAKAVCVSHAHTGEPERVEGAGNSLLNFKQPAELPSRA